MSGTTKRPHPFFYPFDIISECFPAEAGLCPLLLMLAVFLVLLSQTQAGLSFLYTIFFLHFVKSRPESLRFKLDIMAKNIN